MKALVTGGNGFIGSHLVDRLVACGWDVTVLDVAGRSFSPIPAQVNFLVGDLEQEEKVRTAVAGADVVFHLAWKTIHETSNRDPVADIQANLVPSVRLIEECCRAAVQRLVFVSSGGTVYGPAQSLPVTENHLQDPIASYGVTKLAVEKYLQMYHHLHGLDYAILRPSVPYGPRQNPQGRQGAVAVFLFRVLHGLPITMWGDGSVTRDFFYISDLVDAMQMVAEKRLDGARVFNIGGGQEITLLALLHEVERVVGKTALVDFQPARDFDAAHIVLDITRAQAELGWQPRVPFSEGLQRTFDWLVQHFGVASNADPLRLQSVPGH